MLMQMQNIMKEFTSISKKVVTMEEERNALEYQETMNLNIENISITSQQIWRSIYEVINDYYFKAVKIISNLSHV